jgi:hypothetical protein
VSTSLRVCDLAYKESSMGCGGGTLRMTEPASECRQEPNLSKTDSTDILTWRQIPKPPPAPAEEPPGELETHEGMCVKSPVSKELSGSFSSETAAVVIAELTHDNLQQHTVGMQSASQKLKKQELISFIKTAQHIAIETLQCIKENKARGNSEQSSDQASQLTTPLRHSPGVRSTASHGSQTFKAGRHTLYAQPPVPFESPRYEDETLAESSGPSERDRRPVISDHHQFAHAPDLRPVRGRRFEPPELSDDTEGENNEKLIRLAMERAQAVAEDDASRQSEAEACSFADHQTMSEVVEQRAPRQWRAVRRVASSRSSISNHSISEAPPRDRKYSISADRGDGAEHRPNLISSKGEAMDHRQEREREPLAKISENKVHRRSVKPSYKPPKAQHHTLPCIKAAANNGRTDRQDLIEDDAQSGTMEKASSVHGTAGSDTVSQGDLTRYSAKLHLEHLKLSASSRNGARPREQVSTSRRNSDGTPIKKTQFAFRERDLDAVRAMINGRGPTPSRRKSSGAVNVPWDRQQSMAVHSSGTSLIQPENEPVNWDFDRGHSKRSIRTGMTREV